MALGFPNALDAMRLETCLACSLWAFAVRSSRVSSSRVYLIFLDVASPQILSKADDLTDGGELQARPEVGDDDIKVDPHPDQVVNRYAGRSLWTHIWLTDSCSFEDMSLKPELLQGIHAYGYALFSFERLSLSADNCKQPEGTLRDSKARDPLNPCRPRCHRTRPQHSQRAHICDPNLTKD